MELQKLAVDKAISLTDQLGEAWTSLASYYQESGENEKAEAAYLKAIELNPNYATAYQWYSIFLNISGKHEKALQLMYKAAQLDPMSSIVQYNLADQLSIRHQNEEREQVYLRLVQRDPEFVFGYMGLGWHYSESGKLAQGMEWFRKARELDPECCLEDIKGIYLALGDYQAVADIDEKVNQGEKPDSGQEFWQNYLTWIAQSNFQKGIDMLEDMPEEAERDQAALWAHVMYYMYAGEFDKSYEWLLKFIPRINDPEYWHPVDNLGGIQCHYAAIMMNGGEEALGRDLLQFFIGHVEAGQKSDHPSKAFPFQAIRCYTLAGSIDKAMDVLESDIAFQVLHWHTTGKEPWFRQLEDHPRYKAVLQNIEATLSEQRALLAEMDAQYQ